MTSRHVSRVISAPPAAVYAFAANPDNLPRWAAGLSGSEIVFTLRQLDMTDEEFDRDTAAVEADLERLRQLVEGEH
jgi:hypothetical protein